MLLVVLVHHSHVLTIRCKDDSHWLAFLLICHLLCPKRSTCTILSLLNDSIATDLGAEIVRVAFPKGDTSSLLFHATSSGHNNKKQLWTSICLIRQEKLQS
jgi:hypothetical protein